MAFFFVAERLSWLRYCTFLSFRRLHPEWEMVLYQGDTSGVRGWETPERHEAFSNQAIEDYSDRLGALGVEIKQFKLIDPYGKHIRNWNPIHLSDAFRWSYLTETGGWYCDTDVLWVRSLNYLHEDVCDLDFALCHHRKAPPIGLLAGNKGNELFRQCFLSIWSKYTPP